MKRQYKRKEDRRGAALLIVLFVVMTITILSLGFLSRCDTELACGQNMALRAQMDSLAYSGLEHAKGFILYPQDISSPSYADGNDHYDVTIAMHNASDPDPTYRCTYNVQSEAYHLKGGQKTGRSVIEGELRLDPCIAYWAGTNTAIPQRMIVNGDAYCVGSLLNMGTINGDVFASALSGAGTVSGQTNPISALTTVTWPNVKVADFTSSSKYSVQAIPAIVTGVHYGPHMPVKVFYRNGSLNLQGAVDVSGMFVVQGDLQVSGIGNVITARKNLPALLVTGDIIIEDGAELTINGLAVVRNRVRIRASAGNFNVYGGLFAENGLFETAMDYSNNGNTAFLYNCPTWRTTGGQVNGAVEFDGVDDYLQTANSSSQLQLSNDYTISVWVKADASQKIWAGIFSRTNIGGSGNHWTLQFDTSSPRRVVMQHPGGSWYTGIRITDIAGAWHNIRVVRNGNNMRAYLDGSLRFNSDPQSWPCSPGSGNGHLNIGTDMTGTSLYVFKGLIDELAIYNQAAAGANDIPAGLIGYWSFDKNGNGTVNICASPEKAAVLVWDNAIPTNNQIRWSQAGGGFYRSIKRN